VLVSENDLLIYPRSENEIKDVVWSCYAKGALGPDGLSLMFYHKFWDLIKKYLLAMFEDFFKGNLDLCRLILQCFFHSKVKGG
jgi:hypothetical protein